MKHLGIALTELGEHKKAEEYLLKAYKLQPEAEGIRKFLAGAYYEQREYRKSLHYLLEALAQGGDEAIIFNNLATVYYGLGEREKAVEYIKKAYKILRKHHAINFNYEIMVLKREGIPLTIGRS